MNEKQLSVRLRQVAHYVPIGSRIADIGSDHAYLPCYLMLNHQITSAIAGEINEGPFQLAKSKVLSLGLENVIEVRKGDGLAILKQDEVDVVTIAGMGGGLITSILEAGKDKLSTVKKLILQPNIGAESIRRWLRENGWRLEQEAILEEDYKIYEILVAVQGNDFDLYAENEQLYLITGPYLYREKSEVFYKKWHHEINNWKQILTQLELAEENEQTNIKKAELKERIRIVEEALT